MNDPAPCAHRGQETCPIVGGHRQFAAPDAATPWPDCRLCGRRVLVVDDQASILALISRALGNMGLRVTTAEDGYKALDIFNRSPLDVDLVVLDIGMPGPNGFEVCRNMRQVRPDIPVLFLTGYEGLDLETQLAGFRPAMLVRKPCAPAVLRQTVGGILCGPPCVDPPDAIHPGVGQRGGTPASAI